MQHYQRIRDLREDCDLTQEEICKMLYMYKTTYVNYEQGKHSVPLDFALTLADFYQVSLDYIAGRTNCKYNTALGQPNSKAQVQFKPNPKPRQSKSLTQVNLNADEVQLIRQYKHLTERNKGRLEQFIDDLVERQHEEHHSHKKSE